jgi:hypothetical protein
VLAVSHWERLLGGAIYAASPRVDWPTLLKRTFDVDVLQCPKCLRGSSSTDALLGLLLARTYSPKPSE